MIYSHLISWQIYHPPLYIESIIYFADVFHYSITCNGRLSVVLVVLFCGQNEDVDNSVHQILNKSEKSYFTKTLFQSIEKLCYIAKL